MAEAVIMPKTEMAMEEGTIVRWLKNEGDTVEVGEPLLEIESDKATMEAESETAGTLIKIVRGEGETVPVTETIGYIGEAGEQVPEEPAGSAAAPGADASAQTAQAQDEGAEGSEAESESKTPAAAPSADASAQAAHPEAQTGRIRATPHARTLARQHGVELAQLQPSGPDGEIKARDVEAAVGETARRAADTGPTAERGRASETAGAAAATPGQPAEAGEPTEAGKPTEERREKLSNMRKRIAANMAESHREIPPVTLNAEADVTELASVRERLNADGGFRYSFNDFVMKATARAVAEYPRINVRLEEDELVRMSAVNLGMAVALEEGLVVPVIHGADALSLGQLAERSRSLAERAHARKLSQEELSGGTFSVTNLGMYGIRSFTPIINPPEAAILGVCAIDSRVKMQDGRPVERRFMGLSLTIDHRIIDGAQGSLFLKRLTELLENPLRLLAE
jgi:pyruvate dehydrogenase E2 component (dihydrolipoamide acetyltransferase)